MSDAALERIEALEQRLEAAAICLRNLMGSVNQLALILERLTNAAELLPGEAPPASTRARRRERAH